MDDTDHGQQRTVLIYFHVFYTVADACWLYPLNDFTFTRFLVGIEYNTAF